MSRYTSPVADADDGLVTRASYDARVAALVDAALDSLSEYDATLTVSGTTDALTVSGTAAEPLEVS